MDKGNIQFSSQHLGLSMSSLFYLHQSTLSILQAVNLSSSLLYVHRSTQPYVKLPFQGPEERQSFQALPLFSSYLPPSYTNGYLAITKEWIIYSTIQISFFIQQMYTRKEISITMINFTHFIFCLGLPTSGNLRYKIFFYFFDLNSPVIFFFTEQSFFFLIFFW